MAYDPCDLNNARDRNKKLSTSVSDEKETRTILGRGSTPEERGRSILNQILDPIRTIDASAKEASISGKRTVEEDLIKQLNEIKSSTKLDSPYGEWMKYMNSPDVMAAIRKMSISEAAETRDFVRAKLAGSGTSDAARVFENAYKSEKINDIKTKMMNVADIKGTRTELEFNKRLMNGYLNDKDIEDLTIWERIANGDTEVAALIDDDEIYTKITRALGKEPVTNSEIEKAIEMKNRLELAKQAANDIENIDTGTAARLRQLTPDKATPEIIENMIKDATTKKVEKELTKEEKRLNNLSREANEIYALEESGKRADKARIESLSREANEIYTIEEKAMSKTKQRLENLSREANEIYALEESGKRADKARIESLSREANEIYANERMVDNDAKQRLDRLSREANEIYTLEESGKRADKARIESLSREANEIYMDEEKAETRARQKLENLSREANEIYALEEAGKRADKAKMESFAREANEIYTLEEKRLSSIEREYKALKDSELKDEANSLLSRNTISPGTRTEIEAQIKAGKIDKVKIERAKIEESKIQNYDYTRITQDTAKGEYERLSKEIGRNGADEIFRNRVLKEIQDIDEEIAYSGKTLAYRGKETKIFETGLTKQEEQLLNNITYGATPSISDIKAIEQIGRKVSPEGWDIIRRPLGLIETLEPSDAARISNGMKGESWTKKAAGTVLNKTTITAAIMFFALALPGIIIWSPGQVQNTAEVMGLYSQFSKDTSAEGMLRHFLNKDEITVGGQTFSPYGAMEAFFTSLSQYEAKIQFWLDIPIYGDYINFIMVSIGPYATANGIRMNYGTIYEDMKARGLVTADGSVIGYRETTDEERVEIYSKNFKSLISNDGKWIEKYGEMIYGKEGLVDPKSGDALSATEIVALYHYYKGDGQVDDTTSLRKVSGRIAADADSWKKDYPSFYKDIMEFGKKATGESGTGKTGATATEPTKETIEELKEEAIENAMKRDGLTRERAEISVDRELEVLTARGSTELEALEKMTGKVVSGSAATGGGGSSTGGSTEDKGTLPTDEVSIAANKALEKNGYTKLSYQEQQKAIAANTKSNGELDFQSMKNKDKSIKPQQVESIAGKGFVKTYVAENVKSMSKEEIEDAQEVDKNAVANAILDSVSDDCEG